MCLPSYRHTAFPTQIFRTLLLVSRDARHLVKPSSPHPGLAGLQARPVSRAANLGKTGSLDTGLDHGLAFPSSAEGELLACPSAGGEALCRGRCRAVTETSHAASDGPATV